MLTLASCARVMPAGLQVNYRETVGVCMRVSFGVVLAFEPAYTMYRYILYKMYGVHTLAHAQIVFLQVASNPRSNAYLKDKEREREREREYFIQEGKRAPVLEATRALVSVKDRFQPCITFRTTIGAARSAVTRLCTRFLRILGARLLR